MKLYQNDIKSLQTFPLFTKRRSARKKHKLSQYFQMKWRLWLTHYKEHVNTKNHCTVTITYQVYIAIKNPKMTETFKDRQNCRTPVLWILVWTDSLYWRIHAPHYIWKYWRQLIFSPPDHLPLNRGNICKDLISFRYNLQYKICFSYHKYFHII